MAVPAQKLESFLPGMGQNGLPGLFLGKQVVIVSFRPGSLPKAGASFPFICP